MIGAGNVALDSARCALRLGSEVSIVYRRTEAEMPARIEEIENAKEEGVNLQLLTQPLKMLGDDQVLSKAWVPEDGIRPAGMPPGRKRPLPVKDSNFILNVDTVIVSIGPNLESPAGKAENRIKINPQGTIFVDENLMTSIPEYLPGGYCNRRGYGNRGHGRGQKSRRGNR